MGVLITSATVDHLRRGDLGPGEAASGSSRQPVVVAISMFTAGGRHARRRTSPPTSSRPPTTSPTPCPRLISFKTRRAHHRASSASLMHALEAARRRRRATSSPGSSATPAAWARSPASSSPTTGSCGAATLALEDLYLPDGPTLPAGWNPAAVAAHARRAAPLAWGGLVVPALRPLYDYAWFVGLRRGLRRLRRAHARRRRSWTCARPRRRRRLPPRSPNDRFRSPDHDRRGDGRPLPPPHDLRVVGAVEGGPDPGRPRRGRLLLDARGQALPRLQQPAHVLEHRATRTRGWSGPSRSRPQVLAYANPFMATEPRARLGAKLADAHSRRHRRLLLHERRGRGQRERDPHRPRGHRPAQGPGALPLVPRRHRGGDRPHRRPAPLGRGAGHSRHRARPRLPQVGPHASPSRSRRLPARARGRHPLRGRRRTSRRSSSSPWSARTAS